MFILEAIEKAAASGAMAVSYKGSRMTYAQLDERSSAFAVFLGEILNGDKTPVLIYGHKENDFLTCMYGALKSGRAYVPVDTSFPADRAKRVASDVAPKITVDFTNTLGGEGVVGPERLGEILRDYAGRREDKAGWVGPEDDCYIMFTSGSTGSPKGVPISRRNLESLFQSAEDICQTGVSQNVALNAVSYSFDLSVMTVYVAVGMGMTLFTVDKETGENYKLMFEGLKDSDITFWVSTPSFAEVCAMSEDFNRELMHRVKVFFFCGEILTNKLAAALLDRFPGARVLNTYGPTEATVFVTSVEITRETAARDQPLPVGRFFENISCRIIGEDGSDVRPGEKGELHIAGQSVGRGYFNNPELTAKSFFKAENGEIGYRTGDICRMEGDMLHYCGRNDLQIKLNGFRIEIEDIEKNLMKLPQVKRAAVCPIYENGKVDYMTAFLLLENPSELPKLKQVAAIKRGLKAFVPAYMVPRKILIEDQFPVNQNGKVDKKALLARMGK